MKNNFTYLTLALLAVAFGGLQLYRVYSDHNPVSYVQISINPDVQLALNENEMVVDVIPLNEDADVLISDLDIIGLPVEEATEKIADNAILTGAIDEYSNENNIVVTTTSKDDESRLTLEKRVMDNLNNHLEAKKIYAIIVAKNLTTDLKAEAVEFGISNGKMLLVEEAIALNPTLLKDELVKMSIKEIQELIKVEVKARHDALKLNKEELEEKWQIKKEELKAKLATAIEVKKTAIQSSIANWNSLTEAEQDLKIKDALIAKRAEIKDTITNIKEEVKTALSDTKTTIDNSNVAEHIREVIKDRLNR